MTKRKTANDGQAFVPRPGVDSGTQRYGRFDEKTGEYVIERPDLPQPWYNYLSNGTFTGYVSHTGGGTNFCGNAAESRILRTHMHSQPVDHPGRWVYLRDRVSKASWSATWAPIYTDLGDFSYTARVGAGYTTITSRCHDIETDLTYFVAPDANAEIWQFKVTNRSRRRRRIDLFPYAEFMLWSQPRDENLDAGFKCTDMAREGNTIIHQSMYDFGPERGGWQRQYAFLASSVSIKSFDTLQEAFVGVHRGYHKPLAVERGGCSDYINRSGHPCAAMQIGLDLKPGASRTVIFSLGYAQTRKQVPALARETARVSFARAQLRKLRAEWNAYGAAVGAVTGEPIFDLPFKLFAPAQSRTTFQLSRSISPYQLNGSRGLGFRDSMQDVLGAMPHVKPVAAQTLISTLLKVIRPSGEACHTYYPSSHTAGGPRCWDDALWPAQAVSAYVRETGDLRYLDKMLPYWESLKRTTVLTHLEQALRFTDSQCGAHGLPLLGYSDWNDCMNAFPGSESVFTAALYCKAAKATGELYAARGDSRGAARCQKRFNTMAARINACCWDKDRYARVILPDGRTVGTRNSPYGRIFLESNTWAVISGAAPLERGRAALDSVWQYLSTPYGFKVLDQGYRDFNAEVGSISVFPPGIKENASVFNHASTWVIVAEAMLGRGGKAFEALRRMSPATKDAIQAVHCAEPYVVCQTIVLPPNQQAGRGMNAWLTGTASWFYHAMCEYILGLKPCFEGLRIDPCVPGWKQFSMRRVFRGVSYEIEVHNPGRIERGVVGLTVSGREVEGNLLPRVACGRTVKVQVEMGHKTQDK